LHRESNANFNAQKIESRYGDTFVLILAATLFQKQPKAVFSSTHCRPSKEIGEHQS
jgi:hypothetical protein